MTLDEKRNVIEVLLCCGEDRGINIFTVALEARCPGDDAFIDHRSCAQFARLCIGYKDRVYGELPYNEAATEAAYRLIEASPTLRREWFGAR